MIVTSIDKVEIEHKYLHTSSPEINVKIYYNGNSVFEKPILEQGVNNTLLQLLYALYVIFDKTNYQDTFYEIINKMHLICSKENFSVFSIQLTSKLVKESIPVYVCNSWKNLQQNLDLDWSKIDVAKLRNYKVIIDDI